MARIGFALVVVLGCVVLANAATLTCKKGAVAQTDKSCGTTTMAEPGAANGLASDTECTTENHQCLTAKYAGDWLAAYGCYHNDDVAVAKIFWAGLCQLDTKCNDHNDDGVPANGYTTCTTNECNECNSAGSLQSSAALVSIATFFVVLMSR
mmetsp:Transcript_18489/g.44473  ORF Transcript_18489/g.44473 Transcript_18489/m.44473 type:complete len:152 (+) Transcript_18489:48-503(+)|eukprot:1890875-Rhodomonas_salina.1